MLCLTKTDRLFVQHLAQYSAIGCIYSVLRVTNQPAHKMHVAHLIDRFVEPRGKTLPQNSWNYKAIADCVALCSGFYWTYSDDNNQLLNSTEVATAVASSRCSHYRAIEAEEKDADKTTRSFQETLRSQSVRVDNWPRRDIEFAKENIILWSHDLTPHDNTAESIISLPSRLPVSAAYVRQTRQAVARHLGDHYRNIKLLHRHGISPVHLSQLLHFS